MKTINSITEIRTGEIGDSRYVAATITYSDGTTQELSAETFATSETPADIQLTGLLRIVNSAVWFASGKGDLALQPDGEKKQVVDGESIKK